MEQQVKTVDRTGRYRHYSHCNRPRRRLRRGGRRRRCRIRRLKLWIRFPKYNGFLWSSKVKQCIELASIAITIVVTGQENNKDRQDNKDAEEYHEAKGAFEDSQTGQCGVSNSGIGVPGPEKHYSNPPTVSSLPSVGSSSQSYSTPCSRSHSSS